MSNHREREFFMERTLIYTADNSIVSMPVSYFLKQKGFSSQNLVQLKKDPSAVLANGIPCFMNHVLQPGDTLTLHIREDHSSEKIPPVNLPVKYCLRRRGSYGDQQACGNADPPFHEQLLQFPGECPRVLF